MDKCAGLFNSFYSLGAIFAPIIGGLLNDAIGYRYTTDTMAFICLGFCLFYVFTNTKLDDYNIKKHWAEATRLEKEEKEAKQKGDGSIKTVFGSIDQGKAKEYYESSKNRKSTSHRDLKD